MSAELKALCIIASFLILIAIAVWLINLNNFINAKKAKKSLDKVVNEDGTTLNYEIYKLEDEINTYKAALSKTIDDDIKKIINDNLTQKEARLHVLKIKEQNIVNNNLDKEKLNGNKIANNELKI